MSFLISRLVSWRVRTAQGFIPPQPFKKWPRCMFARAPGHCERERRRLHLPHAG